MSNTDLLVVGSSLEAQLALSRLASCNLTSQIHHIPTEPESDLAVCDAKLGLSGEEMPRDVELLDIWGKRVLHFKLAENILARVADHEGVNVLGKGLIVTRTATSDQGVLATMSDGSELLCGGVIFGDGWNSQARAFWKKPIKHANSKTGLQCWELRTANLLSVKTHQFRWAPAKSLELLPLPNDELIVKLRFRSPFGGDMSLIELGDLFSEFGSDIPALLENPSPVCHMSEMPLKNLAFSPARGCYSLGRAAFCERPMLSFDWLSRFVSRQMDILIEQTSAGSLSESSFEAQSKERLEQFTESEKFLRKHLHSERAVLRPIRDLLLKLLPNTFVSAKLKQSLNLT